MPLRQKVGLVLLMAMGLSAMAMSITKAVWMQQSFSEKSNKKFENGTFIFALLENPTLIMMGCIPTLRSLMDHTFSAGSCLRGLFTKCGLGTRKQVEYSTVDKCPAVTGAYLDLELRPRESGHLNGNVQVCASNFDSGNRSEDELVDERYIRIREQFSVTYGPTPGV